MNGFYVCKLIRVLAIHRIKVCDMGQAMQDYMPCAVCTEMKNRKMIYRVFSKYGRDHTFIKANLNYHQLLNYGKTAA
ncbi:MAG: hypothetical protein ACJA01_004606 [Saprospiraceae bacterium]|jgi:hypothetical protein